MSKGNPVDPSEYGFHGAVEQFARVLPSSKHGRKPVYDISAKDLTYFLPASSPEDRKQEQEAWMWAPRYLGGRPRVHLTKPEAEQWTDANLSPENTTTGARVTPSQEVIDTRWAPPPREDIDITDASVEQTLPHINWREFGASNFTHYYTDLDKRMKREDQGQSELVNPPEPPTSRPEELPGQGTLF